MSSFTRPMILSAFGGMLERMPFDKITISGIIRECGISRNTFYYHFRDIYDLLDRWMEQELAPFAPRALEEKSWRESLKALLRLCRERRRQVYHLSDFLSRDRLERYVFSSAESVVHAAVARHARGLALPTARLDAIADVCLYTVTGYFLRFLWNDMRDDADAAVDELGDLLERFVEHSVADAAAGPE